MQFGQCCREWGRGQGARLQSNKVEQRNKNRLPGGVFKVNNGDHERHLEEQKLARQLLNQATLRSRGPVL